MGKRCSGRIVRWRIAGSDGCVAEGVRSCVKRVAGDIGHSSGHADGVESIVRLTAGVENCGRAGAGVQRPGRAVGGDVGGVNSSAIDILVEINCHLGVQSDTCSTIGWRARRHIRWCHIRAGRHSDSNRL